MDDKVRLKPTLPKLYFLIGGVAKAENNTIELVLRWDEDVLIKRLRSLMQQKFLERFNFKPHLKDKFSSTNVRNVFDQFLALQEESLGELLSDFKQEAGLVE